jgi:3-methyl-2-oxobutanoate hydroxymethyltransferase
LRNSWSGVGSVSGTPASLEAFIQLKSLGGPPDAVGLACAKIDQLDVLNHDESGDFRAVENGDVEWEPRIFVGRKKAACRQFRRIIGMPLGSSHDRDGAYQRLLLSTGREEASYSTEKIAMPTAPSPDRQKVTTLSLAAKKKRGEPITMLTAYDYPTALVLDHVGIDSILVGDSLGMVVLGYENTLSVTMEDMLHHCKAVARGARFAHLIGDMPFMSYQVSTAEAVRNAGRFLQEAGMDAVKLEGGREVAAAIEAIVAAGIPVMGHLGLTPQSIHKLGGWKVQGTSAATARRLAEEAHILEGAGCYAVILEAIPGRVAEVITQRLRVPVIGIGAGANCDGQVLVSNDLLGSFDRFTPRFVRKYADLRAVMEQAFLTFVEDVAARRFPAPEHSYSITDEEFEALLRDLRMKPRKWRVVV